ncbi:MAG: multicopper oxidase family protein [Candidatus Eremiobacteraeota bacterium]|nr:multicopper oxidase family protein [Candidatus Eremiobacteraeota bacterium]
MPEISAAIPEVRARAGIAAFRLDTVLTKSGTPAFAYDGRVGVAPTIRIAPGDRIEITLHNRMRALPAHANDVNLHFHGLAVSPHEPSDDVLTMVAHPGQTLHYVVRVPRNHEPGLYWYHPHVHGETFWQVAHGMSGAIVVEGLSQHIPALAGMPERLIVLRQRPTGGDINEASNAPVDPEALENADGNPCRPEIALGPTIDGQRRERFDIGRGQQQFFRVLNASASRYFDLAIDGVPMQLIALDGVPLDAYPGARPTLTVEHVMLAPAGRAEFVVRGGATSTLLRSRCVDSGPAGDAQPATILGDLVVDPNATPSPARALTAVRALAHNVASDALPKPAVRRTIRLTEDANHFYIDGKTFDMAAMMRPAAIVARAGTVEEWNIVNDTDEAHDFHVHQVHFAEEERNGIAVATRHWLDTVNVPSRTHHWDRTTPGTIRLLVDFRNPVSRGRFLFHCHILDHEDRGMMATIEVI